MKWLVALALYGVSVSLILWIRPALMFDGSGNVKRFGSSTSDSESIFSVTIMFPILGIVCFYMACFIQLVSSKT